MHTWRYWGEWDAALGKEGLGLCGKLSLSHGGGGDAERRAVSAIACLGESERTSGATPGCVA